MLNATLDNCSVCSGGNTGHLANSDKDDCGICSVQTGVDYLGNPTYTHLPNSDKDCAGTCFGAIIIDFCNVCGGNNASLACDGCNGSVMPNNCSQCAVDQGVGFGLVDLNDPCIEDCNGDWGLEGERAVNDHCGTCVGGQTGKTAGIAEDCNGVCFGAAVVDDCGICAAGTTNLTMNGAKDCTGTCFGSATVDDCGTCVPVGESACTQDCAGIWGGTAAVDGCSVCSGGTTGLVFNTDVDCYGVCQGSASLDSCGICAGGTTPNFPESNVDCSGQCFGQRLIDHCGNCVLLTQLCARDCAGVWGGNASHDLCLVCSGGTTQLPPNGHMDCLGECFGPAFLDQCGDCACSANACNPLKLPNTQRDECNVCVGTSNRNDRRWNADKDCDGICFGSAYVDDCNKCVGGNTGRVPNADMGCGGVCFSGATDCGVLHWGPVILTSSAALVGLLFLGCIMILRSRLRERRAEFDLRIQASAAHRERTANRAEQFRSRTEAVPTAQWSSCASRFTSLYVYAMFVAVLYSGLSLVNV